MVYQRLLHAAVEYAAEFREDWQSNSDEKTADAIVPVGMTPNQASERIEVTRIEVEQKSRDGIAYLVIEGECAWDPDRGFTVVLHRDRLVGVHQQGTGWTDSPASH